MNTIKKILIIFLLIPLYNCNRNPPNEFSFEQKVINDIFLELIETTYYYHTHLPPPPPPPYTVKDSAENIIYNKLNDERLQEIISDSSKLYLAINDTLYSTNQHIKKTWLKSEYFSDPNSNLYNQAFDSLEIGTKSNHFIDLNELNKTGRFELKYTSNLIKDNFWENNPEISGYIMFSRIYFNESKENGVFYFVHMCGQLCGAGYIVKIINKNNNWEIESKIPLWVS